jgi:heat shock protein HslJ
MKVDSRTEQDLIDALDILVAGAPEPAAVMPPRARADAEEPARRRGRLGGRLLPIAAALVTAGIAAGLALSSSSSPPAAPRVDPNALVGVWWHLQHVNGHPADTNYHQLSLDVAVHGTFRQDLGGCESIAGQLTITGDDLQLGQLQHQYGSCVTLDQPDPAITNRLQRLLHGDVTWSVTGSTLTLRGSGVTATYTPYPRSGTPSRQWTYRGVGISVPASWPANSRHCSAQITNTVLYLNQTRTCNPGPDTDVTTVVFSPLNAPDPAPEATGGKWNPTAIDDTAASERFRQLPDGRQVAEVRVPNHNARVTITSPDAGFAAHLAEFEIYIISN